jgi:N-acetylmuramoyl-L-alanine amidase
MMCRISKIESQGGMRFFCYYLFLVISVIAIPCESVEVKKEPTTVKNSSTYTPPKKIASQPKKQGVSKGAPSVKQTPPRAAKSSPSPIKRSQAATQPLIPLPLTSSLPKSPTSQKPIAPAQKKTPVSTSTIQPSSTPLSKTTPASKLQTEKAPVTASRAPGVLPKIPTPKEINALKDQKLVVIDPGHGGYDLGARMAACDEKSLSLSTALLVKKYLTEMGYRVILTRSRDSFLPLEKRAAIANETKSKLFVSIHFNAAKNPVAKGIEVFFHASEDKIKSGFSKKLAARVLSKIIDKTMAESRGVKEGNFYVIRETRMPSILIEAGFMTHPEELHLLKDINYRDKIARGIAEGIESYFKS